MKNFKHFLTVIAMMVLLSSKAVFADAVFLDSSGYPLLVIDDKYNLHVRSELVFDSGTLTPAATDTAFKDDVGKVVAFVDDANKDFVINGSLTENQTATQLNNVANPLFEYSDGAGVLVLVLDKK